MFKKMSVIIETPESDFCCPICLGDFKENDIVTEMNSCCKKLIHQKCLCRCIETGLIDDKFKCPMCRKFHKVSDVENFNNYDVSNYIEPPMQIKNDYIDWAMETFSLKECFHCDIRNVKNPNLTRLGRNRI